VPGQIDTMLRAVELHLTKLERIALAARKVTGFNLD
jgi:hypothetical protein